MSAVVVVCRTRNDSAMEWEPLCRVRPEVPIAQYPEIRIQEMAAVR